MVHLIKENSGWLAKLSANLIPLLPTVNGDLEKMMVGFSWLV